jgi:hypothetical protein
MAMIEDENPMRMGEISGLPDGAAELGQMLSNFVLCGRHFDGRCNLTFTE